MRPSLRRDTFRSGSGAELGRSELLLVAYHPCHSSSQAGQSGVGSRRANVRMRRRTRGADRAMAANTPGIPDDDGGCFIIGADGLFQVLKRYREAHQPQPKLTLATKGKTEYSIVMEAEPASKDEVIGDLQRVFKLPSGVDLPVRATANGPAIIYSAACSHFTGVVSPLPGNAFCHLRSAR